MIEELVKIEQRDVNPRIKTVEPYIQTIANSNLSPTKRLAYGYKLLEDGLAHKEFNFVRTVSQAILDNVNPFDVFAQYALLQGTLSKGKEREKRYEQFKEPCDLNSAQAFNSLALTTASQLEHDLQTETDKESKNMRKYVALTRLKLCVRKGDYFLKEAKLELANEYFKEGINAATTYNLIQYKDITPAKDELKTVAVLESFCKIQQKDFSGAYKILTDEFDLNNIRQCTHHTKIALMYARHCLESTTEKIDPDGPNDEALQNLNRSMQDFNIPYKNGLQSPLETLKTNL